MMQQVSVLIRLQGCLVVLIRDDNGFQKKLYNENQIVTLNLKESFFPRKALNLVFRE
jgi:hypothetical protein